MARPPRHHYGPACCIKLSQVDRDLIMATKTIHPTTTAHPRNASASGPSVSGTAAKDHASDPLTAERSDLMRHWFAVAPDETRSANAARIWRQTMGRKLSNICRPA